MVLTQMSSLALNPLATIMHYGNRTSGESPLIKALIKGDITTRLKYIQRQKNNRNISRVVYLSTPHNKGTIRALPCKSAELIKLLLGHNINSVALFKSSMHDQYFGDPGQL